MDTGKCRSFLCKAGAVTLALAFVYVLFAYLAPLLLPFLVAFAIAAVTRPVARLLARKLRVPYKLGASVLVVLVYLLLCLLVLVLSTELFSFARSMVGLFDKRIVPLLDSMFDRLIQVLGDRLGGAATFLTNLKKNLLDSLGTRVTELSTNVLTALAQATPQAFVTVVVTVIATFFFALDHDQLHGILSRRMSERRYQTYLRGRQKLKKTIGTFMRSYALIFLITFAQLAAGLLVTGVKDPLLFALLIAVFDILPVVGSGMVLLPWALVTLLTGNTARGVGLMLVYLFVVVSRQFLEPKIVGKSTGVHPLLTLGLMYVGLRLFGGVGLFGLPLLAALLAELDRDGMLRLFPRRRTMQTSCEHGAGSAESF